MNGDSHDFEGIKLQMASAYSERAAHYGKVRNPAFEDFLNRELKVFSASVKLVGNDVLDIGSGPGYESLLLKQHGLQPICVDIAYGMAAECSEKKLETCVADFYYLPFTDRIFCGAWMAFSLLHVPKPDVPAVLAEVGRVLKPGAILYLSLFEGEGEGLRDNDLSIYRFKRYFAYYKQDELSGLLRRNFRIVKTARLDISPRPTISIQCERLS